MCRNMNFLKLEPDAGSDLRGAMLSITIAGERSSDVALTSVDMSASHYS